MQYIEEGNITTGILDVLPLQGFGNIYIDFIQTANGIGSKADSRRQVQLYDCRDWQQTIESNESLGIWHTSDREIHRLPYIGDHSCVFQQKGIMGSFSKYGELCKAVWLHFCVIFKPVNLELHFCVVKRFGEINTFATSKDKKSCRHIMMLTPKI